MSKAERRMRRARARREETARRARRIERTMASIGAKESLTAVAPDADDEIATFLLSPAMDVPRRLSLTPGIVAQEALTSASQGLAATNSGQPGLCPFAINAVPHEGPPRSLAIAQASPDLTAGQTVGMLAQALVSDMGDIRGRTSCVAIAVMPSPGSNSIVPQIIAVTDDGEHFMGEVLMDGVRLHDGECGGPLIELGRWLVGLPSMIDECVIGPPVIANVQAWG